MFNVRNTIIKFIEIDEQLEAHLFIDYSKASDLVHHKEILT